MAYQTIDPNTNTLEKTYSNTTPTQISEMLATGHAFYKQERNVNPATRAATLHAVAAYFRNNADEMAAIITQEMGKRTEEALLKWNSVLRLRTCMLIGRRLCCSRNRSIVLLVLL